MMGHTLEGPSIQEKAIDARDVQPVQRYRMKFAGVGLMLVLASGVCVAAPAAAVSGIVRDTRGVAQMGVLVEALASNSASVGAALTDMYGRYRIANLVPGKYQVRATATLFVPATRANLQLANGTRAVVNLTLAMLSDTTAWLPAERRKADEPDDDWKWTLRSAANRPMLRIMEDGDMVEISSSAEHSNAVSTRARSAMLSGAGGFGGGGVHNVLSIDRVLDDGADLMVRTDVAVAPVPFGRGAGPSTELAAGYERQVGFAGASRLVVSYQSHPEIATANDPAGLGILRMSSAQKMHLGDLADIEAGGTMYAVRTSGYALSSQPFVRITVHPGDVWAVKYSMATAEDLQSFEALDSLETSLPTAVMADGHLRTESGTHQEFAVSRRLGHGVVQAAVYDDAIRRTVISGTGVMTPADMQQAVGSSAAIADTVTDNFQFLGTGYNTRGVALTLTQPLSQSMWAAVEYVNGAALSTENIGLQTLPEIAAGIKPVSSESATMALNGRLARSSTKLRAAYRWQPRHMVTAVGPYQAYSDQAFLSFFVRQSIRCGDRLPPGLEATIDVTNLLAQGYRPFLSTDGHTLYLAQAPRTIQGGLSFTF